MKGFGRLNLDRSEDRSLQAQLASQLKGMIQNGELRPTQRLPSTRVLAEQLQTSRNTVVAAYDMLLGEGYLRSHLRSGFEVGDAAQAFRGRRLRSQSPRPVLHAPESPMAPVPFRPAQPDVNLFSLKRWNGFRAEVLKRGTTLLHYQSRFPVGLDELRQSVAAYLHDSRGVRCRWDEVAITSGSQQALFLLAHLLLGQSQSVYMEDPGYLGARRAWEHVKATVLPVPVDTEGMCLPEEAHPGASLIYVTPSHQFPTGTADDHGPLIDQATLAAFLESGAFHAHLRRCRRRYAERQELFLSLVRQTDLPLSFPVTGQGMNLLGLLPEGSNDQLWSDRLHRAGLDVPPLSRYSLHCAQPGLLFGLTAFDDPAIRQGIVAMARVFSH